MKLLVITNLFPNARQPGRGLFNLQQCQELARLCELTVVAPVPWFPKARALRRLRKWSAFAEVPLREVVDGIEVAHPRYLVVPWVGRLLSGWSFALGIRPTVRRLAGSFRPDAVLATWAYPDVVGTALLARVLRVPLVAKVHGSDINVSASGQLRRRMIGAAL